MSFTQSCCLMHSTLAGNIYIRRNRTGGRGGRGCERRRRAEQSETHNKKAGDTSESGRSPEPKAVRQRAMMPGPGEMSQTGGVHWRCEPCSFGACAHGVNCVPWPAFRLPGEGLGAAGHLEIPGLHQDAGPTIPRKSILPSELLSLRTAPPLGQPRFTLAWPGKSLVLKFA